jgi:hypothetical protein
MLQSLIDFSTIQAILANPIVLAAILAVIRNIGGYIYNCLEAKQLLPYSASQFLVTLALWETLFVGLQGVGNLPPEIVTAIAFGLDFIRGLKTAVSSAVTAVNNIGSTPSVPVASSITDGAWTSFVTVMDSAYGKAGTVIYQRNVYVNGILDHVETSATKPT